MPAVVILGGFAQPAWVYEPVSSLLSGLGAVSVVTFDQLFTDQAAQIEHTEVDAATNQFSEFGSAAAQSCQTLVGHSLGAICALDLVCRGVVKPKRVVLFSGALRGGWPDDEVNSLAANFSAPNKLAIAEFYKGCAFPGRVGAEEQERLYAAATTLSPSTISASLAYLRTIDLRRAVRDSDTLQSLPVLSIHGLRDRIIAADLSVELAEFLTGPSNCQVCSYALPRAGHWCVYQNAKELEEFFDEFFGGEFAPKGASRADSGGA